MMLGGPQHGKPEFIHELCDVARGIESFSQALIRIAPVIRRRALQTNVFEFDLTNVQDVKFADHAGPRRSGDRVTVTLKDVLQTVSWLPLRYNHQSGASRRNLGGPLKRGFSVLLQHAVDDAAASDQFIERRF